MRNEKLIVSALHENILSVQNAVQCQPRVGGSYLVNTVFFCCFDVLTSWKSFTGTKYSVCL